MKSTASVFTKLQNGAIEGTHFDERLDLGPLGDPLLAEPFVDFQWVSVDASDDGVAVWFV